TELGAAEFSGAQLEDFFLKGPLAMIPNSSHPITRLSGEADNSAVWAKLPPLAWANNFGDARFGGPKQAPGVRVLLETPQGQPLFVSGEYGAGRTLAFAGGSTFLWPMHGFSREH